MSEPLRVESPRPLPLVGFEPCGMPRAEQAESIAQIGELLRGEIKQLAFLPSGELLILAGGRVERVDPDTLERIDTWLEGQPPTRLHVLADGRIFVHSGDVLGVARYGEAPTTLLERESLAEVALTPEGTTIACPTKTGVALFDHTGALIRELEAPPLRNHHGGHVAISPSGRHVARWNHSEGCLWRDGELVTHVVRGTRDGVPFEERRAQTFKNVLFLSDARVVASDFGVTVWDLEGEAPTRIGDISRDYDDSLAFEAGRLIASDGYGGYVEFDLESFEIQATHEAMDHHYGRQGQSAPPAASASHVAAHAPTYGSLHVSGPKGQVTREGHLQSLEELTVSRDGRRLAMMSPYRERGFAIDRVAAEIREVVSRPGMQGLAIADDGSQLIFASGANLRPRVVNIIDFEGGEPTATHKGMPWSRGTLGFGGRLYAHSAYNLHDNGWVGIYELGSKRAIAKLKAFPWRFDVSRDGTTAVVASVKRKESSGTVFDLTKKGKVRETLEGASDVALGRSGDALAYRRRSQPPTLVVRCGDHRWERELEARRDRVFAFSEDDSLLFVSEGEGHGIEALRTDTGELVARLPCPTSNETLVARGGLLFALGKDGLIRAYGVPGEAPTELAEAPAQVELEAEAPESLPVLRPWPVSGSTSNKPAIVLELGGRTLEIRFGEGGPALFDDKGEAVKSLRKRKTDDAEHFAAAKAAWAEARKSAKSGKATKATSPAQALREALISGRSVTASELEAMRSAEGFERTLWRPLTGESSRVAILAGAFVDDAGQTATLDASARYRLAHPVHLDANELGCWRTQFGDSEQLQRPIYRPKHATSTAGAPVETDWASTQNKTIERLLRERGFGRHTDNGHADYAITLLAPEFGAVVLVAIDTEHGMATLSFQRWDGTRDGGDALPFGEVDPQLFSEAWAAVIAAYPHD